MRILLIEDEVKVSGFIKMGLEEQGYTVMAAYDGETGTSLALQEDFDLVILDIMIPHVNGYEVCERIKSYKKEIPVLLLTALGTIKDKLKGFELGADDYLTKPFHFEELLARINAVTRRSQLSLPTTKFHALDLEMDCFKRSVKRDNIEITLTAKEFTLLEFLLVNKNRVLTRIQIAEAVWGIDFDRGTNLIDVYINYLRTKIDKGHDYPLIHTVVGVGYILKD